MKYIGSSSYDEKHIRDNYVPFRVMKRKDKCRFAENIARNDFVKHFAFKGDKDYVLKGSKEKDLDKWREHYSKGDVNLKEASYKIGEHTIKISFSQNEEVILVREKGDRNSYWAVLDKAERELSKL